MTEDLSETDSKTLDRGKCPDCGTLFDDSVKRPDGDLRYCPECKEHKLGNLKSSGEMITK